MCNKKGNISGLYNFVLNHQYDVKGVFNRFLNVTMEDVKLELKREDLAARIVVETSKIKSTINTRIVFEVDRLDDYNVHSKYDGILYEILSLIKIKDRDYKVNKIINNIQKGVH